MIDFEQVSFAYSGQEGNGLHDINLHLAHGECILLCGRSGCGKTTITRLVNGLIPQFFPGKLSGHVKVKGRDIASLPMYQIATMVGSVFQNPRTQFFNVDTDSEVVFGMENEARPVEELMKRLPQVADDLHIGDLMNRNIFNLSGGEKQKIAFASVYAMNPEIYLLDEPSSNLDMASIQELKKHLKLIRNQGKTILIAEHRLFYLMDLVDRVVYLDQGGIMGIFSPEEFRQLSQSRREEMGLRAIDLAGVSPGPSKQISDKPVLELEQVSVLHKEGVIMHDINLQVAGGEVIGILGRNGAGKTTLARTLCGLHGDSRGKISWHGQSEGPRARLKHSYMVMQDVNYELFAESVEAECSFGIRNPDRSLIKGTLDALGLKNLRERHPNTLSGGQKQRLAVGVGMICNKEMLVFDEPTSGLDLDGMNQVAHLIQGLAALGKVILLVTHDFEFVCSTCTRVLRIDRGEISEDIAVGSDTLAELRRAFALMSSDPAGGGQNEE